MSSPQSSSPIRDEKSNDSGTRQEFILALPVFMEEERKKSLNEIVKRQRRDEERRQKVNEICEREMKNGMSEKEARLKALQEVFQRRTKQEEERQKSLNEIVERQRRDEERRLKVNEICEREMKNGMSEKEARLKALQEVFQQRTKQFAERSPSGGTGGGNGKSMGSGAFEKTGGQRRNYWPERGWTVFQSGACGESSTVASSQPMKRARGDPQAIPDLGYVEMGFTPHILTINRGEDICSKIMEFSHSTSRAVFILSAMGTISTTTLQYGDMSGGTINHYGKFQLLLLNGADTHCRTGKLSVCLTCHDGQLLGGRVNGALIAGSKVQVVMGSFIADYADEPQERKKNSSESSAPSELYNLN